MTKEEAKKELSYIIDEMPSMECADWIEAISMGIKALDQESCTDAISRQAVIDELCKMLHDCFGADDEELDAVITTLNELPPVTPAEKVGYWIDTDNYYQRWKCSECGCRTRDARPNYYSNCGAKMEEVKK